jgi:hypothetical protein
MLRGKKSLSWDWKAPSALMLPGGLEGGIYIISTDNDVKVIIEPSEGHGQKRPGARWASQKGRAATHAVGPRNGTEQQLYGRLGSTIDPGGGGGLGHIEPPPPASFL